MYNKKVLVVYYSQTGNLFGIVNNFLTPWKDECEIDYAEIKPVKPFPYPWNLNTFFSVFPESALGIPCELEEIQIPDKNYDIIILAFQSWFLYPSIPIFSFVQSEKFKDLIENRKIIMIVQCRNSWRYCVKMMEDKVKAVNGDIQSEYIFTNLSKNIIGTISLLYWLFTGKKKTKFLPEAGVSVEDINNAHTYGKFALKKIKGEENRFRTIIPENYSKFTSEGYEDDVIKRYEKWATYITEGNGKKRNRRLKLFQTYVLLGVVFLAPILSIKNKLKPK